MSKVLSEQVGGAKLTPQLLHDHEEGHTEWVSVEQSAEEYGDLKEAVVHPLHDQEEGHAQ